LLPPQGKDPQGIGKGLRVPFGDLQLQIQFQQFEIGLSNTAHQGNGHPAPGFLCCQELGTGCFIEAPDAAPKVYLPEDAQINEGRILGLTAVGGDSAKEGILAGADSPVVVDLGKELRPRLQGDLASLFHTADGNAQILVIRQRQLDEVLKAIVAKHLPPGEVGKGSGIRARRGIPEVVRGVHPGPHEIGAHGATTNQESGDDQKGDVLERPFHR